MSNNQTLPAMLSGSAQATLTQTPPSEENVREASGLAYEIIDVFEDAVGRMDTTRGHAYAKHAIAAALQRRTDMAERLADALRNVLWLFRGDGSGDEQKARSVLSTYEKEKMG